MKSSEHARPRRAAALGLRAPREQPCVHAHRALSSWPRRAPVAHAQLVWRAPEYRAAIALSRPPRNEPRWQFARDFAPSIIAEQHAALDQALRELEARR